VIVTVPAVGVVQVRPDEPVVMIAVRHRLVPAPGPVTVLRVVLGASVRGRAGGGVFRPDGERALVYVTVVRAVQVPVVHEIRVVRVAELRVTAAAPVDVVVIGMRVVLAHGKALRPAIGAVKVGTTAGTSRRPSSSA
jgi:hypothetical protein